MDAVDRAILEHLKFDGRSSMQDLSELTGLSRSAVFTRVKRLEDQGVIEGYTCLLYTSPSPRDRTRSRMPSSA